MNLPVVGQRVRVAKPGMPDDGCGGAVKSVGPEGCWVVGVYVSPTYYEFSQLVWDGESLARSIVRMARAEAGQ